VSRVRFSCFVFGVCNLGFGVKKLGFRVAGFRFLALSFGFRALGFGFWVQTSACRASLSSPWRHCIPRNSCPLSPLDGCSWSPSDCAWRRFFFEGPASGPLPGGGWRREMSVRSHSIGCTPGFEVDCLGFRDEVWGTDRL
jgi:hypothetical protein